MKRPKLLVLKTNCFPSRSPLWVTMISIMASDLYQWPMWLNISITFVLGLGWAAHLVASHYEQPVDIFENFRETAKKGGDDAPSI